MRILVATDQWFPDRMGGVARVATDTARGWARLGHEVVVLAPRHDGMGEETNEDGVIVKRVLARNRLPQTLTDPRATRAAAAQLAGTGFDVVVGHSCTSAFGVLDAGLDAPLVYVFHASAADEARDLRTRLRPGRDWVSAALLEGPLRRQTEKAITHAASVLVLSEFSRTILGETSPGAARDAVLVAGAVDTDAFTPQGRSEARANLGLAPSELVVLTVRRVEPRMGLENLVEAAGLLEDIPELRVVVAGSGNTKHLERLRGELDLGGRIALVGRLSDEELQEWHRAADLFVLPTLAYEGFGLVTAEALASGTPVVGTPVGATPELLVPLDARLVSRGTDPPALAEAIRTGLALATPELRERCRSFAVDRFSWEANLPAWEQALADVVRRHRSTASANAGPGFVSAVDS